MQTSRLCTATLPQLQALLDQESKGQLMKLLLQRCRYENQALLGDALIYEVD
jgi:hypothetical protein